MANFGKEGIDDSVFQILNVGPYFVEGIEDVNKIKILPILATGVFFSLIGAFFNNLDEGQVKELFYYGEDIDPKSIDEKTIVKIIQD